MDRLLRVSPLCLLLLLTAMAVCPAGEPQRHDPAQNPPTRETYRRLADEIEKHFTQGVLKNWFPRCVDREHGGFNPHFLEDWSPGTQNDKTLVFQSRQTWVAAQVAMRYPDLAKEHSQYARHGLDFLDKVMWDQECGGLYWGLDPSGKITDRYGTEKHVYGIGFAI
jgi:mannobiose 2-epimerase